MEKEVKLIKDMTIDVSYPMYLRLGNTITKKHCILRKHRYGHYLEIYDKHGNPDIDPFGRKKMVTIDLKRCGDSTHFLGYYLSKEEPYHLIMNGYKNEKRYINSKMVLVEKNFLSLED